MRAAKAYLGVAPHDQGRTGGVYLGGDRDYLEICGAAPNSVVKAIHSSLHRAGFRDCHRPGEAATDGPSAEPGTRKAIAEKAGQGISSDGRENDHPCRVGPTCEEPDDGAILFPGRSEIAFASGLPRCARNGHPLARTDKEPAKRK